MTQKSKITPTEFQQASAEALHNQSMEWINQSLQAFNLESFQSVPLTIPQPISAQGINEEFMERQGKSDYYALAKRIFHEQESLFGEQAMGSGGNEFSADDIIPSAQQKPQPSAPDTPTEEGSVDASVRDLYNSV